MQRAFFIALLRQNYIYEQHITDFFIYPSHQAQYYIAITKHAHCIYIYRYLLQIQIKPSKIDLDGNLHC